MQTSAMMTERPPNMMFGLPSIRAFRDILFPVSYSGQWSVVFVLHGRTDEHTVSMYSLLIALRPAWAALDILVNERRAIELSQHVGIR